MKFRGVVYDVGLRFTAGKPFSVEHFNPELVAFDIGTIASGLHCNAIRIEGEEISRLVTASRIAHRAGLSVFFNPWKMNVPAADLPAYHAEAARAAEQLRLEGLDIVFVAGCEISLFNEGIFEGSTIMERVKGLMALGAAAQSGDQAFVRACETRLDGVIRHVAAEVRKEFKGPVTYSAGMWEKVDWALFDIVGVDHYRSTESAAEYVGTLDNYRVGKPLVVMEVGSCAYEGAGRLGGGGFALLEGVNPDGSGKFADGIVPTRSEREQADYVAEQLQLLSRANIDGVFIYVFSFPAYPIGEGDRDFDMMSFALVKTFPPAHPGSEKMPPWEPKEAFHRVASVFREMAE